MPVSRALLCALCLWLSVGPLMAQAQAPCGIVDSIGTPVADLVEGYDDFGRYRSRFGGVHVGIDLAFDRWGEPVRAAMRGVVTYSDLAGWDSEKGVVIVAHDMPDASRVYTLYGHLEQYDELPLPAVGDCVTRETVLGGVGWPSRGRPHLHYEIRNFLPDDGGPGYIEGDPLQAGWYHPLAFTALWQARLAAAHLASVAFNAIPTQLTLLPSPGAYALASERSVSSATLGAQNSAWQVETDSQIVGLAALPSGRVVAHTQEGQVILLDNGRYEALWHSPDPGALLQTLGESLVFALPDGALQAYSPDGAALWRLPAAPAPSQSLSFTGDGETLALGLRAEDGQVHWRLIGDGGAIRHEARLARQSLLTPAGEGSWLGLDGRRFFRIVGDQVQELTTLDSRPGNAAAITMDMYGNSYLYNGRTSLISLDAQGVQRWRVAWPGARSARPPLLDTGSGCLLYALDARGGLSLINGADGSLLRRIELYAGGDRNGLPLARLLQVDVDERAYVSSGFLSLALLDGWLLGGAATQGCLLG
ncbi:MAG: peptidoglycan DD-metalloendopeptidase family protein [Anaerolineaceae bacterium]|nr:peptidoglycan DD-metalloendopeptidase family protein [Anaerolineaceae bacterium]MDE0328820.1 peptidoglycan DD-metalloendopeptidase family protein [Anaerolineaceae bacterium]